MAYGKTRIWEDSGRLLLEEFQGYFERKKNIPLHWRAKKIYRQLMCAKPKKIRCMENQMKEIQPLFFEDWLIKAHGMYSMAPRLESFLATMAQPCRRSKCTPCIPNLRLRK